MCVKSLGVLGKDVCIERLCFPADVALLLIVFAQNPEVLRVQD